MDQGGVAYSEARSRLNTQPVGIRTVPCQSYPCTLNSSDGITHTGKRDTKQHLTRAAAGAGGGGYDCQYVHRARPHLGDRAINGPARGTQGGVAYPETRSRSHNTRPVRNTNSALPQLLVHTQRIRWVTPHGEERHKATPEPAPTRKGTATPSCRRLEGCSEDAWYQASGVRRSPIPGPGRTRP